MEIQAHVCDFCNRVQVVWVRWQNERGSVRHFCDNDCLIEWIARGLDNIAREIALEHVVLRRMEAS